MNAAPCAEVYGRFGQRAATFIDLEIKIGVRLSDDALILLRHAAGDVVRREVHAEVTGNAGFLDDFFGRLAVRGFNGSSGVGGAADEGCCCEGR